MEEQPLAPIVEAPTEAERLDSMVPDAGVEDGTVVRSPQGEEEKIVYDYDVDGNVVGWHKEVVNG